MDDMIKQVASSYVFPIVIGFVMFGLGLSLRKEDLLKVAAKPRPLMAGLLGQLIYLPLVALLIGLLLPVPAVVALGLMVIAVCPGGSTSNAIVFSADGNVALSVALTIASSLVTLLTIPLLLAFALSVFGQPLDGEIAVDAPHIFKSLLYMTAMPVSLGMLVAVKWPALANNAIPYLKKLSVFLILMIIALSVYNARAFINNEIGTVILAAGFMSCCVVFGGYILSRYLVAGSDNQWTIAVEIGVQNTPIAIFLGASVLGMEALSIVAITYGIISYGLIALLIRHIKGRKPRVGHAQAGAAET